MNTAPVMSLSKTNSKESYILVHERDNNFVYADYPNEIVKIEWNGIVDQEIAEEILMTGANLIENGNCHSILLNRKGLEEFTLEARLWIKKDIIMGRGKTLIKKVRKVATVQSKSVKGSVFANFISTGIKFAFPNLNLSKFEDEEEAKGWLIP